jgi:hypothetical protein
MLAASGSAKKRRLLPNNRELLREIQFLVYL